jgi:hypothetical protein
VQCFFPHGLVWHQQRIFGASRPSGPGRAVQVREPNMLTLYDSVQAGAGRDPFAQPNTSSNTDDVRSSMVDVKWDERDCLYCYGSHCFLCENCGMFFIGVKINKSQ